MTGNKWNCCKWLEMAGSYWQWLEIAGLAEKSLKLLEMSNKLLEMVWMAWLNKAKLGYTWRHLAKLVLNGWEWLQWLEMAGNGSNDRRLLEIYRMTEKRLIMAENGWKLLERVVVAGNGWTLYYITVSPGKGFGSKGKQHLKRTASETHSHNQWSDKRTRKSLIVSQFTRTDHKYQYDQQWPLST